MVELAQYVNDYLNYLSIKNYSQLTIKEYRYELNYFLRWLNEKKLLLVSQLTYEVLLEYQGYLNKCISSNTHKNLSSTTQGKKLTVIRELFKYIVKIDVLLFNPAQKLKLPKEQNTIYWSLLTLGNIRKILLNPNLALPIGYRDRTILEVLYSTGVRASELCNLKLNDIDYINNTILIKGKGNKERIVPICDRALKFIKEYINRIRKSYITVKSKQYIFLTYQGNKLSKISLAKVIKFHAKKCGLKKKVSPICFRIACATHLLKNGADIRYVQQLLGHAKIDTTMRYLRLDKSELKKIHSRTHPREITASLWK